MKNTYAIHKKIDYLALSVDRFKPMDDTFGQPSETHPRQKNYNKALEYSNGMIVQWHTEYAQMKTSIVISGEALEKTRQIGFTDYDILYWLKGLPNAKFSRVDICVTSMRHDNGDHELQPHMLHHLALYGLCESKLKLDNPQPDKTMKIETCYIGSRTSRNRMFRAYDKGIELGLGANKIIRYELETRKNANHIATELLDRQTDIAALIRRYVDFPQVDKWIEIMSTEIAENWRLDEYETDNEKNNRRWEWLFTSVAPALAKALFQDDLSGIPVSENTNADKFASIVAMKFNELVDKNQI